jgi:hypothetical protein
MTTGIILRSVTTALLVACGAMPVSAQVPALGPADGRGLPPVDTGRVKIGELAPDFTLESLAGGTTTLSGFRGKKNVILQFYRGHW